MFPGDFTLRYEVNAKLPRGLKFTAEDLATGFREQYFEKIKSLLRLHSEKAPITERAFRTCTKKVYRWVREYVKQVEKQHQLTLPDDCLTVRFIAVEQNRLWGTVTRNSTTIYPLE